MAIYTIQTPDGQIIDVEGPDNASDEDVVRFTQETLARERPGQSYAPTQVKRENPQPANQLSLRDLITGRSQEGPSAGIGGLLRQGFLLGLGDEAAGVGNALANAIVAPFSASVDFDPAKAYREGRDRERAALDQARRESPWLGGAAEVIGGLGTGLPARAPALTSGLGSAMRLGAKQGAIGGALGGFGYGEGVDGSIAGAGLGLGAGGLFGAALPAATRSIGNTYRAARSFLEPETGIGRELVARAMKEDSIRPTDSLRRLVEAQERGTPLMIGDLGENLRGLTGAVSRKPGPSRTLVRNAVEARQAGQGERIRGAIERDLGSIENPLQVSDNLMEQARAAARPLYEQAYASPPIVSPQLEELLNTPAGKGALSRARTIAANERRDPAAMGFAVDAEGNVVLNPVTAVDTTSEDLAVNLTPSRQRGYTPQTLDYVKRGLDDIVEAQRDQFGRLRLDEAGRAINDVRANFVRELDRLNPDYGAARAAYAGPASLNEAMQRGQNALNASAEEIERSVARMSEAERAQFALGYRAKLAEALDRRVEGGDKVGALLGTPRKQKALAQVFGGEENFGRFVQTMADERAANETYRAVSQGSQTAGRLADDADITDQSLLEDLAGRGLKGAAQGGVTGALAEVLNLAKDSWRFGAGETGKRARQDAAALLSQVDLDALRDIAKTTAREQAARRVRIRAGDRAAIRASGMFGRGIGGVAGISTQPIE